MTNPHSPRQKIRILLQLASKAKVVGKGMESTIIACDEGKTRNLLAQSYDVNYKGYKGYGGLTPLLLAARYRHERMVKALLELGADPGDKCERGNTALHWLAVSTGIPLSGSLIDLLLENRSPLYASNEKGMTPLHVACEAGELLLATKLIGRGANVHACDLKKWTPLHFAAHNGKAQLIPLLVASGAELEARTTKAETCSKWTALHLAAWSQADAFDTVEQLLRAGADKEAKTVKLKCTPLHLAALRSNEGCVASLLNAAANVKAKDKKRKTSLYYATNEGKLEIVNVLLDHGADPDAGNRYGWVSLYLAAKKGKLEIVKALLDHGANPNAANEDGRTSLHLAARKGKLDITKTLLDHGADPNLSGMSGSTSLHYAAKKGKLETIKALLDRGADPNISGQGGTCLHYAVSRNKARLEIVKTLLDRGADPNISGVLGWTCLHSSVSINKPRLEIVKTLLDHGANPNRKNSWFRGYKPSQLTHDQAARDLLKGAEKAWEQSRKKKGRFSPKSFLSHILPKRPNKAPSPAPKGKRTSTLQLRPHSSPAAEALLTTVRLSLTRTLTANIKSKLKTAAFTTTKSTNSTSKTFPTKLAQDRTSAPTGIFTRQSDHPRSSSKRAIFARLPLSKPRSLFQRQDWLRAQSASWRSSKSWPSSCKRRFYLDYCD